MTITPDTEKPDYKATWILVSSSVVSSTAYRLWCRMYPLDRGERGCYASTELLAALVGFERDDQGKLKKKSSAETVEVLRRDLLRVGLLEKVGDGRYTTWHVRFPSSCLPPSGPVSIETCLRLAGQLDQILRARGLAWDRVQNVELQPGNIPPPPREESHRYESTSATPTPGNNPLIAGSIAGGASRATEISSSFRASKDQNDQQLALSRLTLSVVDGEGKEGTAVDSQQETEREKKESGPNSAEWQAQKARAWMPQHGRQETA